MGKKASVDIETTGTEPAGAAVLSVGIVVFDDDGVYAGPLEAGFWRMDPRWVPGRRDRSTYDWWKEQDINVYAEAFDGTVLPWEFCAGFSSWVAANEPDEVWANPARFDFGHLRELFYQMGVEFPIHYKKERCLMTLKATARSVAVARGEHAVKYVEEEIKKIYESNKAEHSAIADAIEQAYMTRKLTEFLEATPY